MIAAVFNSLPPILINSLNSDVNAFLFAALAHTILCCVLISYLTLTASRTFPTKITHSPTARGGRASVINILSLLCRIDEPEHQQVSNRWNTVRRLFTVCDSQDSLAPRTSVGPPSRLRRILPWLWLPMVWVFLGRLDLVLFVESTRYIETAVTTVIFEVQTIILLVMVAGRSRGDHERGLSTRDTILAVLVICGIALVIFTQATSVGPPSIVDYDIGIGVGLGLMAATVCAFGVLASMKYSESMHSRLFAILGDRSKTMSTEGFEKEARQRYWLGLAAYAISLLATIPPYLAIGVILEGGFNGLDTFASYGWVISAFGFGLVGLGWIIFRETAIRHGDSNPTALWYLTPILSLVWLSIIGIHLDRVDWMWIGAALVFSMNCFITSNPDDEGDYQAVELEAPWGVRLGFASLVFSIWSFGSLIYVRDELFPTRWLQWRGGDYWTVVALSATIFALIIGFRIARLTNRSADEDEGILAAFRKFEWIVNAGSLPPDALEDLRRLDTASPRNVLSRYERIRGHLRQAMANFPNHAKELLELQGDVDRLTHSKQQGRDFSELVSIFLFAITTIAMCVLSRPRDTVWPDAGWTGFLSEAFATMLVSIVVFLAFHLIDMRRDRQVGLVAHLLKSDSKDEYGLFFRYRPKTFIDNLVAVILVVFMMCVVSILLYGKWL